MKNKTIAYSPPLLYFWNVKMRDLSNIAEFIYTGQVEVNQSDLSEFLKISDKLEVEGIGDHLDLEPEDLIKETENRT